MDEQGTNGIESNDGSDLLRIKDVHASEDMTSNNGLVNSSTQPVANDNIASSSSSFSFVKDFFQTNGPPQITFVFLLIALASTSTWGIIPSIMSDRYARLHHGYNSTTSCSNYDLQNKPKPCILGSNDAQTAAATSELISTLLTFVTSSLIGSFSDEYGRKGILIVGLSLQTIAPICLVLLQLCSPMSPVWYYGTNAISGLVNWQAIAVTTIADVLPPNLRASGNGLLLSGFLLGAFLSPSITFLTQENHFYVSITSLAILELGVVVVILILPETLSEQVAALAKQKRLRQQFGSEEDTATTITTATTTAATTTTVTAMKEYASQLWTIAIRPIQDLSIINRNSFFRLLSTIVFVSSMVQAGLQTLEIYYFEEQLDFHDTDIALLIVVVGISGFIAQVVVLKPLCDWVGEKWVVILSFLIAAVEELILGWTRSKQIVIIAVFFGTIRTMAFPTIAAIKSNNVEKSEQGQIQGALFSLTSLAAGLGPIMFRSIQQVAQDSFLGPGAMFLAGGIFYMVAAALSCLLSKEKTESKSSRQTDLMEPLLQVQQDGEKDGNE